MNVHTRPAPAELAAVLARCDDRAGPHVLGVARDGDVRVISIAPGESHGDVAGRSELRFWYEVFPAGCEYTGPSAARDVEYVESLYVAILRDWNAGLCGLVESWHSR